MKDACRSFQGGTLPDPVKKPLPKSAAGSYDINKSIQNIAATFVDLQRRRHLADYDLSERFKRTEVLTLIELAEAQIEDFSNLPDSVDRQFFLVCLLSWKELGNR